MTGGNTSQTFSNPKIFFLSLTEKKCTWSLSLKRFCYGVCFVNELNSDVWDFYKTTAFSPLFFLHQTNSYPNYMRRSIMYVDLIN